mmetsp:Transcript_32434/g.80694  ORF Transcript_32434/g.80694 Transcript_32434/m.80694 type:complete len:265 (-) Transcript_32434:1728-2522(-)
MVSVAGEGGGLLGEVCVFFVEPRLNDRSAFNQPVPQALEAVFAHFERSLAIERQRHPRFGSWQEGREVVMHHRCTGPVLLAIGVKILARARSVVDRDDELMFCLLAATLDEDVLHLPLLLAECLQAFPLRQYQRLEVLPQRRVQRLLGERVDKSDQRFPRLFWVDATRRSHVAVTELVQRAYEPGCSHTVNSFCHICFGIDGGVTRVLLSHFHDDGLGLFRARDNLGGRRRIECNGSVDKPVIPPHVRLDRLFAKRLLSQLQPV